MMNFEYAFKYGNIGIRWYSVMLLLAVLVGGYILFREGRRFRMNSDFLFNMLFWTLIMGIIGARAYYVIFNFDYYKNDLVSIFKIWEKGLAIHGGIIAGFITLLIYCKKYKARVFKITDICVVPLLIGQAIGRWGNFFNQEAFGTRTTYMHLKGLGIPEFVINKMDIYNNGVYYTPTFFYESIWCFIGFIVLLIVRRLKYVKVGQLTCLYMMWYGVGRFIIEGYRTDSLLLGGFKAARLVSIAMFIIGLIVFMILSRKSKFENLYNEENADRVVF